mmetsp:Transcript_69315/g.225866  ORF Transcript_69315/g.225866 Transcript_69315/m.225866 type:complete len:163 (-) Transcript_69315:26-514(-)
MCCAQCFGGSSWWGTVFLLFLCKAPFGAVGIRVRKYPDRDVELLLRGPVEASTAKLGQELLQLLTGWLTQWQAPSLEQMARQDVPSLSDCLQKLGTHMLASGLAKREPAETVNAVVQILPWLRGSVAGSWKVVTTWEQLEPPELQPPLPLRMLKACMVCALH